MVIMIVLAVEMIVVTLLLVAIHVVIYYYYYYYYYYWLFIDFRKMFSLINMLSPYIKKYEKYFSSKIKKSVIPKEFTS